MKGLYTATADTLTDRIRALIPDHPEIMEMESAWDLFKVEGFDCKDLSPSAFQAGFALSKAQELGAPPSEGTGTLTDAADNPSEDK